jgi:hypothetical protein
MYFERLLRRYGIIYSLQTISIVGQSAVRGLSYYYQGDSVPPRG